MNFLRLQRLNPSGLVSRSLRSSAKNLEVDTKRYTLADGSILLSQSDISVTAKETKKKMFWLKWICLLFPPFFVYCSREDDQWSSIYYELVDYYFGSGYVPTDIQYIWDALTESLIDLATFWICAYLFFGWMRTRVNRIHQKFCTHIFYNEKRKRILFRSLDYHGKAAHYLELSVNEVKFLCGEYRAPEIHSVFGTPLQPGDTTNGYLYKSEYGFSHVVALKSSHDDDEKRKQQLYRGVNDLFPYGITLLGNREPIFDAGEVLYVIRNGSVADPEIFNEYFSRFDVEGESSLIHLEETRGMPGEIASQK